jgi:hypothetical protein
MKKILLLLTTTVLTLFATTEPLHVDLNIYTNKSFLNKQFTLAQQGYITVKVPTILNIADIKFQIPEQCTIDNKTLSKSKKSVNKELEELEKQKNKLGYELEAIFAKNELLKTLSLKDQLDLTKIDKTSEFLAQQIIKNLKEIEQHKKAIALIDEKIKIASAFLSEFKELTLTYTCKQENKILSINYLQQHIKTNSFYNINADTNKKSVTIEKKTNIFYQGIENLPQVDINIYSYGFNQSVAPAPFYPQYLDKKKAVSYAKVATMEISNDSLQRMSKKEVTHQNLQTKSMYKIKNAELITGQYNLFDVDKKLLDADFKTVIDAYGTNKAYLEATIKTKKDYQESMAKYFLNSNPISSRYIDKIEKDKETKLYFGEDEHIQIQKKLVETLDEKTFFGDKKISTQNWEYTITNKKPYNTKVSFIESVPISKDADITVKIFAQPKENFLNAEGKIIWNFSLEENEQKKILFGYEVSNSK